MSISSFITAFEAEFKKDEQYVVNQIAAGWKDLQAAEQTVAVDVEAIFGWIQAHQSDILALFKNVLTDLAAIGSVIPQTAPAVAVATTAIDAATAAVDVLSAGITAGSTPLSTIANAYQSVKNAQTAVNGVLKLATSAPVAGATGVTAVAA